MDEKRYKLRFLPLDVMEVRRIVYNKRLLSRQV